MPSKFISFHSMVIGTGKSSLIVQAGKELSKLNYRVLLVDGYMYEIGALRHKIRDIIGVLPKETAGKNLYDLIEDYETISTHYINPAFPATFGTVNKLNLPSTNDHGGRLMPEVKDRVLSIPNMPGLDFLPGNNGDVLEIKKPIDFERIFEKWDGRGFFHYIKQEFTSQYDFVLCDTHTGYETLAGVICGHMADQVIAVSVDETENAADNQSYQADVRLTQRMHSAGERPAEVIPINSQDIDNLRRVVIGPTDQDPVAIQQ